MILSFQNRKRLKLFPHDPGPESLRLPGFMRDLKGRKQSKVPVIAVLPRGS